jgi:DNA mismatch repair protein MutH
VTAFPPPPQSELELFERADALAGRPLGWVAARHAMAIPPDLRRAKGWVGHVLETALGASSGSQAQCDFPHLGVELKTLPVDARGKPTQSTFVCTAPLDANGVTRWADCWVRQKLSRVLFVPVESSGAPAERHIGSPVLWTPSEAQDAQLRADWEELTELAAMGHLWQLTGKRGSVLQLRPKGADGASRTWHLDDEARWVAATPRAFYMRATFTATILAQAFSPPR